MIKIIERGTRTIVRCNECGCKFSYEDVDIVRGCVTCPQCGVDIAHHKPSTCYSVDCGNDSKRTVIGRTDENITYLNGTSLTTNKKQVLDIVDVVGNPVMGIVEPNTGHPAENK